MSGTHLGAAVQNLLYNKKRVDADGIPAVTKGRIRIRWFRIRRVCEYHKMRVVPRRTVDPPSLDSEKNRQMEVFFRENVTIQNHAHVS